MFINGDFNIAVYCKTEITPRVFSHSGVHLWLHHNGKSFNVNGDHVLLSAVANKQRQAANRNHVGEWCSAQIDVYTTI